MSIGLRVFAVCIALSAVTTLPAEVVCAESFVVRWTPKAKITTWPASLSQKVDSIEVLARAYALEFTSGNTVFGPFPTRLGEKNLAIFGVDQRKGGSEQLGLLSQPAGRTTKVAGTDAYAGGSAPGFENGPYFAGDTSVHRMELAVFQFSKPVTVSAVIVDGVSNYQMDAWVAGCPSKNWNPKNGLLPTIKSCLLSNLDNNGVTGRLRYDVELPGTRLLFIGARPMGTSYFGRLQRTPDYSQFFIEAIHIRR